MGFHLPKRNSIYHLHLHLIVTPLLLDKHENLYGKHLTSPDIILKQLQIKLEDKRDSTDKKAIELTEKLNDK